MMTANLITQVRRVVPRCVYFRFSPNVHETNTVDQEFIVAKSKRTKLFSQRIITHRIIISICNTMGCSAIRDQ